MEREEKIFIGCFAAAIIGGILFFVVLILYDYNVWRPTRIAEHEQACAEKGYKPASYSQFNAATKSNRSTRFCVDAEGRMYWPKAWAGEK